MLLEDLANISQVTVDAAMSANPVTVDVDATLEEVLSLMVERDIGAVLVTNAEGLAGIFTDVDAVRVLHQVLNQG